ncbi:HD family phosphohydrolase [Spirochaetia bacterium]|nr:HD family phosphohydrolase [Spirochaetia bacterium]
MTGKIIQEMIRFFGTDVKRIAHALKVYAYARTIAELEKVSPEMRESAVTAAILHDVGIKIAEDKYGSCTFRQQEEEGPLAAVSIMSKLSLPAPLIERVSSLIGHHHTPEAFQDSDFRILLEADFLVNFEEGNLNLSLLEETGKNHFRTTTGKNLLTIMFGSKPV